MRNGGVETLSLDDIIHGNVERTTLSVQDRAKNYVRVFPQYLTPPLIRNGRMYDVWIIGAVWGYQPDYYGKYPYKFRDRVLALFPDCLKKLDLFSGSIKALETTTFDIKKELNPTICDDVRNVKNHKDTFAVTQLVMADPPYDKSDFAVYGEKPFDKSQVIRDLGEIMSKDSFLTWLDTHIPMYSKKTWELLGHIGVITGTNVRMRCLTMWRHV